MYKSENAFSTAVGVSNSSIRQYLSGSTPGIDKAAQIAAATGVELQWLITGEGPKLRADRQEKVETTSATFAALDKELFGRVVDCVLRTYKASGIHLSGIDIGRIAAEKYTEIAAFDAPPDEWPPLLELLAIRLRKEIAAAAAEPGSGKASA